MNAASQRVSLNPTTIAYLEEAKADFPAQDMNELIQAICIERRQLRALIQPATTLPPSARPVASAPASTVATTTLDALDGLLNS